MNKFELEEEEEHDSTTKNEVVWSYSKSNRAPCRQFLCNGTAPNRGSHRDMITDNLGWWRVDFVHRDILRKYGKKLDGRVKQSRGNKVEAHPMSILGMSSYLRYFFFRPHQNSIILPGFPSKYSRFSSTISSTPSKSQPAPHSPSTIVISLTQENIPTLA